MRIDSKTRLVTLLGYPLGHSLSPLIHNAAFDAQQINMVYLCMPVVHERFDQLVGGLEWGQWVGSNVTIPHKQRAFELADELSDQAMAVGAVNTLVLSHNKEGQKPHIYGDNTDIKGFSDTLVEYREKINGREAVVLGSGGSARAIVYALLSEYKPGSLTIVARSVDKAEALAKELSIYDGQATLRVVPFKEGDSVIKGCSLLVNTTPVGMHPDTTRSPLENAAMLDHVEIVYDLIYNPGTTALLAEAKKRGAIVIGGLEMLLRQAAASYVQWTGKEMPLDYVRQTVLNVLQ